MYSRLVAIYRCFLAPFASSFLIATIAVIATGALGLASSSAFAFAAPTAPSGALEKLTIERIFSSPSLLGSAPRALKFSRDGGRLVFLKPKNKDYETLDLWQFDLKTGEPRLLVDSRDLKFSSPSEEEKSRRERLRISSKGITEYILSSNGQQIVFPAGGELYLHTQANQKLKRLTTNSAAELDVQFSPKDHFISYVRDHNLYLFDLASNKEFAVSTSGKDQLSYGVAEFIAQEEMDRFTGFWWSEDEQYLAFIEVDESPVKIVSRYEIDVDTVTVRQQRYPEAGSANAKVRLAVVKTADVTAGNPHFEWVDLGRDKDIYLPRVTWTPDGKLAYQVQSRDQKTLSVFLYDPEKKQNKKILTETDKRWVELNDDWRWLKNSKFIWASERSGYKHLYLYDQNGRQERALTRGEWLVDEVVGIDERGGGGEGWVYFTSGLGNPLEKHLYRAALSATTDAPERLTPGEGFDEIAMDHDAKHFVRTFYTAARLPVLSLHASSGEQINILNKTDSDPSWVTPEFGSFKGPSGDLLYYRLYKPKNFDAKKKYSLIVTGYGGPTAQWVRKAWRGDSHLLAQVMLDRGYLVASIDNRGSIRRGAKFSKAHYHAVGTIEVEDQKAGVEHLVRQGFVDAKRVGFFGWSYGGYLALMLAARASDTYRANVAVAPVTDFRLYDTHYTERYLGQPEENRKIYDQADVLKHLNSNSKTRLLIMHGMADDNVLFTNSTKLFKKLQTDGVVYESVTYPGGKHGIWGRQAQIHVFKTILDFFDRSL